MAKNIKMKTIGEVTFRQPGTPFVGNNIFAGKSRETAHKFGKVYVKKIVTIEMDGKPYAGYVFLCLDEVKHGKN